MRDSIAKGIEIMIENYTVYSQLGIAPCIGFVHIVLTDGADMGSKIK
jgi:hypothetical protein